LVRHLMYPLLEAGAQNSRSAVARVECADVPSILLAGGDSEPLHRDNIR
jgi:hypothetical protein